MSSELQLDVRHLNRWIRHLVNAYEVWCSLQVKLCDPCLSALKWFVYHARRLTVDCIVVWRDNTPGCQLTNDCSTVQLRSTPSADTADSVLCMSASATVQCGHSLSFHLHHVGTAAEAMTASEQDGVGLSVNDYVNMDTDDVIFYSFHGNPSLIINTCISSIALYVCLVK